MTEKEKDRIIKYHTKNANKIIKKYDFIKPFQTFHTLRGTFALWFLPVLFIAEILFFCLIKYLPKWMRIVILIVIPVFGIWESYFIRHLIVSVDPLTFERISFLILPISKALIALWFLEIGHIGCMLFSKVTSREIRFMIGLVFTIGNIFLSY